MSDRLPDFIDPLRLAEKGQRIEGRIKLARLSRLVSLLSSQEGEATVALQFGIGDDGVRAIEGEMQAQIEIICQRCMSPMSLDLEAETKLGIARGEREAELLPEAYEPFLVGKEPVYLADLVEDELILALPFSPKHVETDCAEWIPEAEEVGEIEEKPNPFSVLAGLKSKSEDE